MKITLQILIGLVGVLFLFTGIRWLLDPGTAAQIAGYAAFRRHWTQYANR